MDPLTTLAIVLGAILTECLGVYLLAILLIKAVRYSPAFFGFVLRTLGTGKSDTTQSFLEVTFPASTSKSAFATEQLHILLRSYAPGAPFWDRWAGRKSIHSFEIASTKDDGIRYIMVVPSSEVEYVKNNVRSFLPGAKIREVNDYLPTRDTLADVTELKLQSDFVLPLQDHKALEEHDPVAYLTGHMTKLVGDELVAFQIVAAPVTDLTHRRVIFRARDFRHRIALDKELSSELHMYQSAFQRVVWVVFYGPLWLLSKSLIVVTGIIDIFASSSSTAQAEKRPASNPYERELGQTIKSKLDQYLFEVTMRVIVTGTDADTIAAKRDALLSSFMPFTNTRQSIGVRKYLRRSANEHLLGQYQQRQLARHIFSQQTILSSSELSDLYHFPNTDLTKTEGLVKSRSRELATPLSLKRGDTELDVIVGANLFGGEVQEIGMTLEQRQKHTYIIGKTGTGKTTLLKSSIYQDMLSGKGLAVLDPHGDMFRELLSIVPENRRKDVVVFDPSDRDYPVGLNILDPGIEFASEDDKHDWITSAVLSVFKKLSDETQWGPRMEHILRNTTLTALQTPKPSLYTLQRLLTDKKYQKEVAKSLKDPVLKQFWDKEFKMMGSMQMSAATAPLTHRLGHFITSKMSRHILLQEETTVRIADIMNEGKILLVNLSKGDIGEDQSEFFGTILTALIWMAAYQRTKIPEKKRRDFFVYVDEFQNFATPQFGAITSEGRKFHVSLIVSHQNIAQMEDKDLVKVIAGNAATIICLKANPEDETFILPFMKPEVEKGDIVNLAPYHFYMKVTGDESEDAFSGQTVPLDVEESSEVTKLVVKDSRKRYAKAKLTVEKEMGRLLAVPDEKAIKRSVTRKVSKNSQTQTKPKVHDL